MKNERDCEKKRVAMANRARFIYEITMRNFLGNGVDKFIVGLTSVNHTARKTIITALYYPGHSVVVNHESGYYLSSLAMALIELPIEFWSFSVSYLFGEMPLEIPSDDQLHHGIQISIVKLFSITRSERRVEKGSESSTFENIMSKIIGLNLDRDIMTGLQTLLNEREDAKKKSNQHLTALKTQEASAILIDLIKMLMVSNREKMLQLHQLLPVEVHREILLIKQ